MTDISFGRGLSTENYAASKAMQPVWSTKMTLIAASSLCLVIAGCSFPDFGRKKSKFSPSKYGVSASPKVVSAGRPTPKGGGRKMVGKPYRVAGKWYRPKRDTSYKASGLASWYGPTFHGRMTANGEVFDRHALTAAHPTMPLPSYARVTNVNNGRSVVVRVNDRGPFHGNRVIDVSEKVAGLLGFKQRGVAKVDVHYVGPARMDGRDHRNLIASYAEKGVPSQAVDKQRLRHGFAAIYPVSPLSRPARAPFNQSGQTQQIASASSTHNLSQIAGSNRQSAGTALNFVSTASERELLMPLSRPLSQNLQMADPNFRSLTDKVSFDRNPDLILPLRRPTAYPDLERVKALNRSNIETVISSLDNHYLR